MGNKTPFTMQVDRKWYFAFRSKEDHEKWLNAFYSYKVQQGCDNQQPDRRLLAMDRTATSTKQPELSASKPLTRGQRRELRNRTPSRRLMERLARLEAEGSK